MPILSVEMRCLSDEGLEGEMGEGKEQWAGININLAAKWRL